jgi:hypothetical protein
MMGRVRDREIRIRMRIAECGMEKDTIRKETGRQKIGRSGDQDIRKPGDWEMGR